MAITKIEQIYLHTDMTFESVPVQREDGSMAVELQCTNPDSDSAKALTWFKENGITDFANLNYGDPATHADCLGPLNTWNFVGKSQEIQQFPFVYYTEVHDDLPVSHMPVVLLYGLDEIVNSNLVELYQLGK